MTFITPLRTTLYSFLLVASIFFLGSSSAAAAQFSLTTVDTDDEYYELFATVRFLEAYLAALEDGERSPAPSYIVHLQANTVTVLGALARDPDPSRMEVCGPTTKGVIDWGDGSVEDISGLGCSGDVDAFVLQHTYDTSDSFHINVTDEQGREREHTVAVRVSEGE